MKRNKFSLSNYRLTTCNLGDLIPVNIQEILPGDTVQQQTSAMIRFGSMNKPVMHPVVAKIHHWFVPYRLIWDDFEDFITGAATPTHPVFSSNVISEHTLHDYFGVQPYDYNGTHGSPLVHSALPCRAYNLIYNEHYADQDLVTPSGLSTASGTDVTTSQIINKIAWEKDYFTTCRAQPYKNNYISIPVDPDTTDDSPEFKSTSHSGRHLWFINTAAQPQWDGATPIASEQASWDDPNLIVDINKMRLALAMNRYEEARQQYGERYVEYLRYLGIRGRGIDGRLQNPEYLSGGRQLVQFSEVLQTAEGTGTYVGDLYGHGITAMRTNRYRRFFPEHGFIMTLMAVQPKSIYVNAMERFHLKTTKEDYHQRELEGVGDQIVTKREVCAEDPNYSDTFGYQQRYDEYRRALSGVSAQFRDDNTIQPEPEWHLGRIQASVNLNSTFINCNPSSRIFQDTTPHGLKMMVNNSIQVRRMVKKVGNPTKI